MPAGIRLSGAIASSCTNRFDKDVVHKFPGEPTPPPKVRAWPIFACFGRRSPPFAPEISGRNFVKSAYL